MMHLLALLLSLLSFLQPADKPAADPVAAPKRVEYTVEGKARNAILYIPADAAKTPAPVVFVFHGHGGSAQNIATRFQMHKLWPQAICVSMQGLATASAIDPKGERPGWQLAPGDNGDQDLKFFDAVLEGLKKDYKVDASRIYSTGHSNGAMFTYILWAKRGETFAAVAPCAGFNRGNLTLTPKPVMHIAGRNDKTVPFSVQRTTMDALHKLNTCDDKGGEWARDCTLFTSKSGAPLVEMIHDGDHAFPEAAPPLIVKFFKENSLPSPAGGGTGGGVGEKPKAQPSKK